MNDKKKNRKRKTKTRQKQEQLRRRRRPKQTPHKIKNYYNGDFIAIKIKPRSTHTHTQKHTGRHRETQGQEQFHLGSNQNPFTIKSLKRIRFFLCLFVCVCFRSSLVSVCVNLWDNTTRPKTEIRDSIPNRLHKYK